MANYQTLCRDCNRGKGNREELNKTPAAELAVLLDDINPQIRRQLGLGGWCYTDQLAMRLPGVKGATAFRPRRCSPMSGPVDLSRVLGSVLRWV